MGSGALATPALFVVPLYFDVTDVGYAWPERGVRVLHVVLACRSRRHKSSAEICTFEPGMIRAYFVSPLSLLLVLSGMYPQQQRSTAWSTERSPMLCSTTKTRALATRGNVPPKLCDVTPSGRRRTPPLSSLQPLPRQTMRPVFVISQAL